MGGSLSAPRSLQTYEFALLAHNGEAGSTHGPSLSYTMPASTPDAVPSVWPSALADQSITFAWSVPHAYNMPILK